MPLCIRVSTNIDKVTRYNSIFNLDRNVDELSSRTINMATFFVADFRCPLDGNSLLTQAKHLRRYRGWRVPVKCRTIHSTLSIKLVY